MEEKRAESYQEEVQLEDVPVLPEEQPAEHPQVTFVGNKYDLIALVAVVTALVLMFMCLTCNMGYFCLPVIPLVLGIIGLVTAKSSLDAERTRLFSWIGVGVGGITLLLWALAVIGYFAFVFIMIMANSGNW